jgi:hypothetical protein
MPFEPGNQAAKNRSNPKLFAEALLMEIKAAGSDHQALRKVARALLDKAETGDVPAINAIADRLDGKVPQAVDANLSGNVVVNLLRFAADRDGP